MDFRGNFRQFAPLLQRIVKTKESLRGTNSTMRRNNPFREMQIRWGGIHQSKECQFYPRQRFERESLLSKLFLMREDREFHDLIASFFFFVES